MPFGKYRGRDIRDIPHGYLAWVVDHCVTSPTLCRAIEDVLFAPPPTANGGFDVDKWYRELATRFHPDKGGTNEAMAAVNAGYELAKAMLKRDSN